MYDLRTAITWHINERLYNTFTMEPENTLVGIEYTLKDGSKQLVKVQEALPTDRVIRDGKVAVLYSSGFGSGWSTWVDDPAHQHILMFHPKLVDLIERTGLIPKDFIKDEFGINEYVGHATKVLQIAWLPVGTKFSIQEFDGHEEILSEADLNYVA